jgi:hypothetical protein
LSIKKLPDYNLKQKILYIDKTAPGTLTGYGDLYLAEGALSDALDFYARAANRPGMQKIKDLAAESGDTFLFQNAAKTLGDELQDTDWEKLVRRAAGQGKYLFARRALEKIAGKELLTALTAEIAAEEAKQGA